MKKKLGNDETDEHPFYSDKGIKDWKRRIRVLEQQEKELGQRRKHEKDDSGGTEGA